MLFAVDASVDAIAEEAVGVVGVAGVAPVVVGNVVTEFVGVFDLREQDSCQGVLTDSVSHGLRDQIPLVTEVVQLRVTRVFEC